MATYCCEPLAALVRQLYFAPARRRLQQIDRAEKLYWKIDPQQNYPIDFITYQITGHRTDQDAASYPPMTGQMVQADLLLLVVELSQSLSQSFDDYTPRPLDQTELARRLNVAPRTIARWRAQGLFARMLSVPTPRGPRFKLAFLSSSVDRFLAARPQQIQKAGRFNRLDESTRHQIVLRARRIASRTDASPFRVAQHLARKYHRSIEAVRQILVQHDQRDRRFAIFPGHQPRLTARQKRLLLRAWQRGISVQAMTRRYGPKREAIYNAIAQAQAAALATVRLNYVPSPTFTLEDAQSVILQPSAAVASADMPDPDPLDAQTLALLPEELVGLCERAMAFAPSEPGDFVRYNYLKFRAGELRSQLDRHQPSHEQIDRIQTFIRRAAWIQRQLVYGYLREVARVARFHTPSGAEPAVFERRLSIGVHVLFDQIERFDASRGGRFIASLRWAMMRRYAQDKPAAPWRALALVRSWVNHEAQLPRWIALLEPDTARIIERRFDFPLRPHSAAQTLAAVAGELNLPPIMVNRRDRLGMFALRRAAGSENYRLDRALPLGLRAGVPGRMKSGQQSKGGSHG